MTKTKWLELAERCEKATGPDREINCAVFELWSGVKCGYMLDRLPDSMRYTASLDAITALIERELPGFYWSAITRATPLGERTAEGVITNGKLFMTGQHRGWDVFAYTPATALCAAFCRAMAERAGA